MLGVNEYNITMCSRSPITREHSSPLSALIAGGMDTKQSLGQLSRSKAKRLNRKAKLQRIESAFHQEKGMRVSAENATKHWKKKAILYKRLEVVHCNIIIIVVSLNHMSVCPFRIVDEAELDGISVSGRKQTQRPFTKPSTPLRLSVRSIAKATPSAAVAYLSLPPAPLISESMLDDLPVENKIIGDGCFGSCTQMSYKDMFVVCAKRMEKERVSIQALRSEAAILYSLNTGGFTPHCFGVCLGLHAIIMSYINIDGKPVSLFSLLYIKPRNIQLSKEQCIDMLISLCKGLQHVHASGFLHNDLKLDNIVVGNSLSGKLKPYIIDFGKACPIAKGKKYSLSEEDIVMYKKEHPQVAPDLRDGLVQQSQATDIYSLGRILKRCNSVLLHSPDLSTQIRKILSYHSHDRPELKSVLLMLNNCGIQ